MVRIAVLGTTGSGKTMFSRAVAGQLAIPHIELDALFWLPNWTTRTLEAFRAEVAPAVAGDSWVADGNYSMVADLIWPRADHIVWIDTLFWLAFLRLFRRSASRAWTGDLLWGINRESWKKLFFERNSILVYFLLSFGRNRQRFGAMQDDPRYADRFVRLRDEREIRQWIETLAG